MGEKQEVITAVENPFFIDADGIETIDKQNIVFLKACG